VDQVWRCVPIDILATFKPSKFGILETDETCEGRSVMLAATLAVTMEYQALQFAFDFVPRRAAKASTLKNERLSFGVGHDLPSVRVGGITIACVAAFC
jgi:hypothetical protein